MSTSPRSSSDHHTRQEPPKVPSLVETALGAKALQEAVPPGGLDTSLFDEGPITEIEVTLALLAKQFVRIAEEGVPPNQPRYLYQPQVRRALDRLSLAWLLAGQSPLGGISDLLTWARRPLASWPIPLPSGLRAIDEALLGGMDGAQPTALCAELTAGGADAEMALWEEGLLKPVLHRCRERSDQNGYRTFRQLLIERPALTQAEYDAVLADPVLLGVADVLARCYVPAPAHLVHGGQFALCAWCHGLMSHESLVPGGLSRWQCQDLTCPGYRRPKVGVTHPARATIRVLRQGLRTFISTPGRAELRLARALEALGLEVELWPGVDRYDLRVGFPGSAIVWALDVKDWRAPRQLAARLRHPIPTTPPWSHAFYVFPRQRRRLYAGGDYLAEFRTTLARRQTLTGVDLFNEHTGVLYDDGLLRRARQLATSLGIAPRRRAPALAPRSAASRGILASAQTTPGGTL